MDVELIELRFPEGEIQDVEIRRLDQDRIEILNDDHDGEYCYGDIIQVHEISPGQYRFEKVIQRTNFIPYSIIMPPGIFQSSEIEALLSRINTLGGDSRIEMGVLQIKIPVGVDLNFEEEWKRAVENTEKNADYNNPDLLLRQIAALSTKRLIVEGSLHKDFLILNFEGVMDFDNAPYGLRDILFLFKKYRVIIDLSKLVHIDSTGVGDFLVLQTHLQHVDGILRIVLSNEMKAFFQLYRLLDHFHHFDSIEASIENSVRHNTEHE